MADTNRFSLGRRGATRLAAALAALALAAALPGAGARADTMDGYYSTDPSTGQTDYVDPDVGMTYYVDPTTGYYLDPLSGVYVDPATNNEYELDTTTGTMVEIDPVNLHTGDGAGGNCPTGVTGYSPCTGLAGGEITLVGPDDFSIYLTSYSSALANPLMLILAIPNDNGGYQSQGSSLVASTGDLYQNFFPGSSPTATVTVTPGVTGYGSKSASQIEALFDLSTKNFFQGSMTSGDIYHYLAPMLQSNSSFNMTNLTSYDGLILHEPSSAITSFGIYVYSIASSVANSISGKGLIDLASNLPEGTFVLSLGCSSTWPSPCSMSNTYTTPFTQGGLVGIYNLPEPGSLGTLASSLAALGFVVWRRRRNAADADDDPLAADPSEG